MKFKYILEIHIIKRTVKKINSYITNAMDTATDCVTGKCLYMSMSSH